MENYYKTLGVSRHSSMDEIKKAYIKILKVYHPDVYQGDKQYAEEVTSNANIAYSFLSNPASKLRLDEYLHNLEMEQLNRNKQEQNTKDVKQKSQKTKKSKGNLNNAFFANLKNIFSKKSNGFNDNQIKKQVKKDIKNKKIADDARVKLNLIIFGIFICLILLITILVFII